MFSIKPKQVPIKSKQYSRQPIKKIVDELSKLKQQLRSIKSMKTLPLRQKNPSLKISIKKGKEQGFKQRNDKSIMNRYKQTLKNTEMTMKQQIQTQRKILENKLNMSICKQITKSYSNSKQKPNYKSFNKEEKSQSKSLSKRKHKNKERTIKTKSQKKKSLNNDYKNQDQLQRTSSFDNMFANTKSIRKINDFQKNRNDRQAHLQQNKTSLKPFDQNQNFSHKDISFCTQRNNLKFEQKIQDSPKKENNKIILNIEQVNYRLRTKINYQPQFNKICISSNFKKEKNLNSRKNQLALKSQIIMNSLRKVLLRFPNFILNLNQATNDMDKHEREQKLKKTLQQIFVAQINQHVISLLSQKYTQYLQQIQCEINQLVNFFNQYQNQKQMNYIVKERNNFSSSKQKQNDSNQLNAQRQGEKQKWLKRDIKKLKKQLKTSQTQLKQQQIQFTQLQFKYILKCQSQENQKKFNIQPARTICPSIFQPSTQTKSIQNLIQILQQQNIQLSQKLELLTRQLRQKHNLVNQHETRSKETGKLVRQTTQDMQLLRQDLNLTRVQLESIREKLGGRSQDCQNEQNKSKRLQRQVQSLKEEIQISNQQHHQKSRDNGRQISNLNDKIRLFQQQLRPKDQAIVKLNRELIQSKKHSQNQNKNQIYLNKRTEELTKQIYQLKIANDQMNSKLSRGQQMSKHIDQLQKQKRSLQDKVTILQGQLMAVEQQKERLVNSARMLSQRIQLLTVQGTHRKEQILLLEQQLDRRTVQIQHLQQSLSRYKDRCITAQMRLKQQKYIDQQIMLKQAHKRDENIHAIKSIIKEHQDRLNSQQPGHQDRLNSQQPGHQDRLNSQKPDQKGQDC